jgi:acetate kinase
VERTAKILGKPKEELNIITAHIGNGVSLCAVKKGKSVDTTMGMTPLAGIAMGTRSGDIDPAIIEFIADKEERSIKGVINILNKESGLLGISGVSSDGRDIKKGIDAGNERCLLAHRVQAKRITYFIAAFFTYMGGADAIVFTAGIGENDAYVRQSVCDGLKALGVEINYALNDITNSEAEISTKNSRIKVMVVPTNEELMMAKDTYRLINN